MEALGPPEVEDEESCVFSLLLSRMVAAQVVIHIKNHLQQRTEMLRLTKHQIDDTYSYELAVRGVLIVSYNTNTIFSN